MNDPVFRDEGAPVPKNSASWNIVPQDIRINFDACKIDGCASRTAEVLISLAELKPFIRPDDEFALLSMTAVTSSSRSYLI